MNNDHIHDKADTIFYHLIFFLYGHPIPGLIDYRMECDMVLD